MFLVVPFFLFSEIAPGLTQNNPIKEASMNLKFGIDKMVLMDLDNFDVDPEAVIGSDD